ncbi:MAG: hypothetical protein ABIF85_06475 [Nanoarchaeota archaeon]|nr:hypothetical protein [Nanoarchaeota archaeon]
MEFVDNLMSAIYVIIGTACAVALIVIFVWAKTVIGDIETRGSSIALSEKLLSAPCINLNDIKGSTEKFVFNKTALDKYNNSIVCAGTSEPLDLPGSLYYIEVKSGTDTWYFQNNNNIDYAYNTHARGITKRCISDRGFFLYSTVGGPLGFETLMPSPYNYGSDGNFLRFSGVVNSDDKMALASIKVILDADSGTDFYADGYPLCLCDIQCPYTKCFCSKICDKSLQTVGFDDACS